MNQQYNLDFQKRLASYLIKSEEFVKNYGGIIDSSAFGDEVLSGIVECALQFHVSHGELPELDILLVEIKENILPGRKYQEYVDMVSELKEMRVRNESYLKSKVVEFVSLQRCKKSLQESLIAVDSGDLEEALRLIAKTSPANINVYHEIVHNYFSNIKDRFKDYRKKPKGLRVPTGFNILDSDLGGGLGPGELGIIVAPPKFGKTTTLINIASGAMKSGKSVVYVSLELSKRAIGLKFDSLLSKVMPQDILKKPETYVKKIASFKSKYSDLFIVEYPTKSATVDKIKKVCGELGCDMIIVDYGQLLKSQLQRGDRRHEITDSCEALRRIAGELKIPVWTAHQSNRPGAMSKVVQMEHVAEDFNVVAISDVCISVNHTDSERRSGRMRLFVMANRLGPTGNLIHCDVDWYRSIIKPIDSEESDYEPQAGIKRENKMASFIQSQKNKKRRS